MVRKVFALLSVSALEGLFAVTAPLGCSDSPAAIGSSDAGDAGAEASEGHANKAPQTGPETTEPYKCYSDKAIDATGLPFRPPKIDHGKCTKENSIETAQIEALVADAKAQGEIMSYTDIESAIEAKDPECKKCIFTEDGDEWGPVIVYSSGKFPSENYTACLIVESGSRDCGRYYAQFSACADAACGRCRDSTELGACVTAIQSTACKDSLTSMQTACGPDVSTYTTECLPTTEPWLYNAIRYQCIDGHPNPNEDGGTDGGDGGDGG